MRRFQRIVDLIFWAVSGAERHYVSNILSTRSESVCVG